jgi:hypothetical protein
MPTDRVQTVVFPNSNPSRLIRPRAGAAAHEILSALALPRPRALLILNGGTAELAPDLAAQLGGVLGEGLARAAAEEQLTVITGGTDAGVFRLFGGGLARWGRTAPCIGVSVAALVAYPGHPRGEAPLEPHHSHFVLTAGRRWGDETATMYALAAALANDCPSLAVFAGGGEIALREMQANIAQGRTMLLLAGSGRNTDAVLAAAAGEPSGNPGVDAVARYPGIVPLPIEDDPSRVRAAVRCLLFGGANRAG